MLPHSPFFPKHFMICPSLPLGLSFLPEPMPDDLLPFRCPFPLPLPLPKNNSSCSSSGNDLAKWVMAFPVNLTLPRLPFPFPFPLWANRFRKKPSHLSGWFIGGSPPLPLCSLICPKYLLQLLVMRSLILGFHIHGVTNG